MIPQDHHDDVVHNSMNFMRAIAEAYGKEQGLKLWDTIADTIDPDLKGQILMAMLTGAAPGRIRVWGHDSNLHNKVNQIKAVRAASGWALKEAKDAVDALCERGTAIVIECDRNRRDAFCADLRNSGLRC